MNFELRLKSEYDSSVFQCSSSTSLSVWLCIKQTPRCTGSAASQNRPVGQCESFMARRTESVRVNLFCPGRGQTLTQSLALRQEGSGRLETAPKHEHNHTNKRETCASYVVQHCFVNIVTYFTLDLGQAEDFLLLLKRLHSSLLRCVSWSICSNLSFINMSLKETLNFWHTQKRFNILCPLVAFTVSFEASVSDPNSTLTNPLGAECR